MLWVKRMGSQLDCGEVSARETCIEPATYPVPNDEGDRAFEGLFHLALAVIALGRGRLATRRLEKWLTWSNWGECVDAVDLDGHWLDMAVSVDGDNERASLLLAHCSLASSVSAGQATSPRGPPFLTRITAMCPLCGMQWTSAT